MIIIPGQRLGGAIVDGIQSWKLPEYKIWTAMIQRCSNPNMEAFRYYGGRDIHVHPPWIGRAGFIEFLKYIGRRPTPQHELDRIDPNGHYEPGNVRWALPTYSFKRPYITGQAHKNTRLNDVQTRIIKRCRALGMQNFLLVEFFNVSTSIIQRAVDRKLA